MSDDRFADYRRGIENGVMTSATPNEMLDCLNEIKWLRAELDSERSALRRLRFELADATKAGTPYWSERDAMNGLIVDNQAKTDEIERLRTDNNLLLKENERLRIKLGSGEMLEGDYATLSQLEAEIERLKKDNEQLQAEIERLRDNIRYWSYCTSQGMRAECPAKVEDLANFLISLGIAPYYMRNTCCETVRTADDDSEMDQRLTDRDME